MAEAAQSLCSKELQAQTLAPPVMADDNETKLNEGTVDKTEIGNGFGGTQNGEEADEGYKGNNTLLDAEAVDKPFEPPIGEFWGKYAENVDGEDEKFDCDDENKDKIYDKSENSTQNGGETGEGFNGNIKLSINNNGENCDRIELEKVKKEGESKYNENVLVYSVGDLVWSKFNSYPWWPAQIYDSSEASDHARKYSRKGEKKLLVVYFGDGSFSWRSPAQLKPFAESFDELSKRDDSLLFRTSVQSALDELGRVAELEMICPCVPEANKAGLSKKAVVNFGIKEGVLGPDCNLVRVPFSDIEPAQMVSKLKSIAEAKPVDSMFELVGLKSCLSAFYRSNGGRKVAFYHEFKGIEGLGDESRSVSDQSVMKRCGALKENDNAEPDTKKKLKSIDMSSKNGDDVEDMSGSRKRKKSRHVSHPYTDSKLKAKIFRSKRNLEEAESVRITKIARVGERMKLAAANLAQPSPILKKKLGGKSDNGGDMSALSGPGTLEEARVKLTKLANIEVSPKDPQKSLDLDIFNVENSFISAEKVGSNKCFSSKPSLGIEKQNEMTFAEFIKAKKMEMKKAKKTNDEGLVFIKEKLKKMTLMVENCSEVMVPELKLSLEKETKELLEILSSMAKPASS